MFYEQHSTLTLFLAARYVNKQQFANSLVALHSEGRRPQLFPQWNKDSDKATDASSMRDLSENASLSVSNNESKVP